MPVSFRTQAQVATRVGFWVRRADPGLSLRGTAGWQNPSTAGIPHPDHAATWNALAAYRLWDPANATNDCHEYVVTP